METDRTGRSRRAYLAALATAGSAGLAGCAGLGLGGGGGVQCEDVDEPAVQELPTPVIGDPDADVRVVAFEDFACPHCATYSLEVVPQLRSEYVDPGTVRYEFHDFPLPVDERWSWVVASAARGVQDETDVATFFDFVHDAFENQDSYSLSRIKSLAEDSGAPGCAVVNDARNETYRPVVEADRQLAREMGARGTPAVYVNGRAVTPTYDDIAAAIEQEL